jgi:hypothetical protein
MTPFRSPVPRRRDGRVAEDGVAAARHRLLVGVVLLGATFAATFALDPWADDRVNDLFVYRAYADAFLGGAAPYRDVAFEYPPLAAVVVALGGVAGSGPEAYEALFALLMLIAAVGVLAAVVRLARATGGDTRLAALAVGLAPLLYGASARTHFDLFPVALLAGGVALVVTRRHALGFAILGLGAMAKGFPLFAALPLLAWLGTTQGWRKAVRGGLALALPIAVLGLAAVLISPAGVWASVSYQLERPVQVESVPASLVNGLSALGAAAPQPLESHRSDGIRHSASGIAAAISGVAFLVILTAFVVLGAWGRDERGAVLCAFGAVAAFATLGKVLSPQFVLWLLPLLAVAAAWRIWRLVVPIAAALALTLAEFPGRYFDVVAREPSALLLVAARNAALVAVLWITLREARALAGVGGSVGKPSGSRKEDLLDRRGEPVLASLD